MLCASSLHAAWLATLYFSDSHFLRPHLAPAARTHRLAWEDAARTPRFTGSALQLQAGAAGLPRLVGRESLRVDHLGVVVVAKRLGGRIVGCQMRQIRRPCIHYRAQGAGRTAQQYKLPHSSTA